MKNPENCDELTPFCEGAIGEQISDRGSHTHVNRLENKHVVKYPKREYKPPLWEKLNIGIKREDASKILVKLFGEKFKINPDMEFIKNGVAEHALMSHYFSPSAEAEKNGEELKPRDEMLADIRNEDSPFYRNIRRILGKDAHMEKLAEILEENKNEDFLLPEQTVVGHPRDLSREKAAELQAQKKDLPYTFYIIQEMVESEKIKPLNEVKEEELTEHPEILKKLLTFAILTKKMYNDTDQLIDTRPDEVLKHPLEWFQETSNIMLDLENDKIYFVDTRWLYDRNTRIIGRNGLDLIDHLGQRSVDRGLKRYERLLSGRRKTK